MGRRSVGCKFNVTVNKPARENVTEYDLRVGKAAAKTLIETLPPECIDELIENYKERKKIQYIKP